MASVVSLFSSARKYAEERHPVTNEDLAKEVLDINKPLYLNMREARKEDARLWVERIGPGSYVSFNSREVADVRLDERETERNRQVVHITLRSGETLNVPSFLLTNYTYDDQGMYPEGYRPDEKTAL